jgi:hypothetical protein
VVTLLAAICRTCELDLRGRRYRRRELLAEDSPCDPAADLTGRLLQCGQSAFIGALQVFATPYIMTAGGPARATLFYTQRLYESAFYFLRMGYACAMA